MSTEPINDHGPDTVQLAHGGGGRMSAELIDTEIVSRFGDGPLAELPDAATLGCAAGDVLFSTDSFVVSPLIFPGGDIGCLAVHGTVNDIAVAGGIPRWLSLALILEEGLPLTTLRTVLDSVKQAAVDSDVKVVTGDTKVVRRGQCDGMYCTTAGIGTALPRLQLARARIRAGDRVLVSGPLGDHGAAVLCVREGIDVRQGPVSDTGPVHRLVHAAAECAGESIRFMRDPTRGGAAAVLNETVADLDVCIELEESTVPVSPETAAVTELLGLDILHIACEGRIILICAPEHADAILHAWRALPEGRRAAGIGTVGDRYPGKVIMHTLSGGRRLVDVPQGEVLPRIC